MAKQLNRDLHHTGYLIIFIFYNRFRSYLTIAQGDTINLSQS